MATVDVINMQGDKVGQLELADAVFNAPVKEHLLWEVVVSQLAARRRGTASTKTRAEVAGAKKKVYRQKGTGRARHGTIRAPIYVGGGVAHGPKPRSYAQRTPKKVRRGALVSALSLRQQQQKLVVFDNLDLAEIKTKRMAELLGKLGIETGLFVDDKGNERLIKSVRNLAKAKYLAPEGVNVYDVLKYKTLLCTREGAKRLEERLSR
ncbi:MAG: 50S ribosomal protein L4 [Proteobacteria bacterium]|nr:MAG: 50S ribosomal protein L4 [Pseudomonadota bacterium]PIE17862.1 MAG: 50S ribosomal protein L4 [Pseudomonadota bacterium]